MKTRACEPATASEASSKRSELVTTSVQKRIRATTKPFAPSSLGAAWCYKRVSKFILFYFYKNMANVLTEYWFAYSAGFSGQVLFADWLSLGYNAVFTSFACIFGYCLDQDINVETIRKYPRSYEYSMFGLGFDMKKFFAWIIVALWHATACYYIPKWYSQGAVDDSGVAMGNWFHGTTSFVCIIIVVHAKMSIMVYSWNYLVKLFLVVSVVVFFVSISILCFPPMSKIFQPEMTGLIFMLYGNGRFWFAVVLSSFVAILPDCLYKYIETMYFPSPHHILHEREMGHLDGVYTKPETGKRQVAPINNSTEQ